MAMGMLAMDRKRELLTLNAATPARLGEADPATLMHEARTQVIEARRIWITGQGMAARAKRHAQEDRERFHVVQRDEDGIPLPPAPPRPKRQDVVAVLVQAGKLGQVQQRAADEILRIFEAITIDAHGRVTAAYGERIPAGRAEDLPPTLRTAYVERYAPWRKATSTEVTYSGCTIGEVVMAVVVDNLGMEQAGRRLRMRRATVLLHLARGLWRYCRIGGWVTDPEMPDFGA